MPPAIAVMRGTFRKRRMAVPAALALERRGVHREVAAVRALLRDLHGVRRREAVAQQHLREPLRSTTATETWKPSRGSSRARPARP